MRNVPSGQPAAKEFAAAAKRRLDLRLNWLPGGAQGRWMVYLDVINATNRKNAAQIEPSLAYNPSGDVPLLIEEPGGRIPLLPSVGVRFRF